MTRTGEIRRRYRHIEQAPSRFTPALYAAWAARADRWGRNLDLWPTA
jgi:hypothetical protein